MLEVEIKAIVIDSQRVEDQLKKLNPKKKEKVLYYDIYFDSDNSVLQSAGRELRVRKIINGDDVEIILTYKDRPFDLQTQSKPEYEVKIDNYENMLYIIKNLGYRVDIEFTKYCKNIYLIYNSQNILASIVNIPELESCYLEIETLVKSELEVESAMENLKRLLIYLQIPESAITAEYYTKLVRDSRNRNKSEP